jgi:hypothetical protein
MAKRSVAGTAADPTVEYVPIELSGSTWKLAYDFNAIAEAESITGCNLLQGVGGVLLHTMTATQFRGLFYAALRRAHPEITIHQAGLLMTIENMADIREALLKAYGVSMPERQADPPQAEGAPADN